MFGLSPAELAVLKPLSTPSKIQDFLDAIPINYEKKGYTCYSPRLVLRHNKAQCIEGALFAAAALWLHGQKPLLLDFRTLDIDEDHVVAPFLYRGCWGAISKTNHGILRYRDPVYRTVRELSLSYFNEYFMFEDGKKTLREYSRPFSLKRFGVKWITSEDNLFDISDALDGSPHYPILPKGGEKTLRRASPIERRAGMLAEWRKKDRRT
jgi:hypothetical protein